MQGMLDICKNFSETKSEKLKEIKLVKEEKTHTVKVIFKSKIIQATSESLKS